MSMLDQSRRGIRTFGVLAWSCLWCLSVAIAGADPVLRCLWSPSHSGRLVPPPGVARIQYGESLDDNLVAAVVRVLGPDRTFHFRYDVDWPDDHAFPNGIAMGQMHAWLSRTFDAWNRAPSVPVRLALERGHPDTQNVIRLDDTSSETSPNTGVGGYSFSLNGTVVTFSSRAVINVDAGSLTRRELVEAIAKHELGHCMTLRHSSVRAAVMGYATGSIDYGASTGYFALDDILGLRSVWARSASGFGSLVGHLDYPDGSVVGAGDVIAVDDATGELLASGFSDSQADGRFRIELPAGRRVRLMAHPMHADAALFGEHFLPSALLTPGDFAPTEYRDGNQAALFTVPDGASLDVPSLTVAAPADTPLLDKDAPVLALLPGERRHLMMHLDGLGTAPAQVQLSLTGLTTSHVTTTDDRVEFDVTSAANAAGTSEVEVKSGSSTNVQAGSIWVRPTTGFVRATSVAPLTLLRGGTTSVVVKGLGLENVTGVRVTNEGGTAELPASLTGPAPSQRTDTGLTVSVTTPADAAEGPWEVTLLTAEGDVPRAPEPRPRVWVGSGHAQAEPALDLGEVPVGQPVEFSVPLTNRSGASYRLASYRWTTWLGQTDDVQVTDSPDLAPGATGSLRLTLTPGQLGPTVATFQWLTNDTLDAVTEVRLWAIPAAGSGG